MRAVVQRVSRAEVRVDNKTVGKIGKGILVLLGVGQDDNEQDLHRKGFLILGRDMNKNISHKMNPVSYTHLTLPTKRIV